MLKQYFKIIKNLFPEEDKRPSIGLDIGINSCKMVEVKKKGDAYEMLNWVTEPIQQGKQTQAIKSILNKRVNSHIPPKTSILGKGTLIRYIDMPRMSLQDLKQSLSFEADKYFPFPSDMIYTDCCILETKGKDKMSVLLAASKKEMIDNRIKLLTDVGLQVDFVSLNPIAISNVINVLGLKEEDDSNDKIKKPLSVIAFLDMGEMVSSLTILVNNCPQFTRDIFVGGREITKSISTTLALTFEEAEALKKEPKEKKMELLRASDSAILNLISELRLSLDYFMTEKSLPISLLLVTGGASMMGGLPEVIAKYLELPVRQWDPLEGLTINENISSEELKKNASQLGVALGLALYC